MTSTYPTHGGALRGPTNDPERRPASSLASGISAGRWFGVQVRLDLSLIVIFTLVLVNLGAGLFPSWHPDWSGPLRWGVALLSALAFFSSILVHELSHALVARRFGMRVHGITLFMFGGIARIDQEARRPREEFLVAIVGPIASLAIGIGSLLLGGWLGASALALAERDLVLGLRALGPGTTVLLWLGPVNLALAAFNMIPGFPLDGGRVLRAALWWTSGSLLVATRWSAITGQAFGSLLVAVGVLMMFGVHVPLLGVGLLSGLWLSLIGWFVSNAARRSYEQLRAQTALANVSVSELMWRSVEPVTPDTSVQALAHEQFLHSDQQSVPVAADGRLLGMVSSSAVRRLPAERWGSLSAADVMVPVAELRTLGPDDDAAVALRLLGEGALDQIPVLSGGTLIGTVRKNDVLRWIALHDADLRGAAGDRRTR